LAAFLAAKPGVTGMSTAHRVVLESPDLGPIDVSVLLSDIAGDGRTYLEARGEPSDVWKDIEGGSVAISEPLARRFGLELGSVLRLAVGEGYREFPVAGVFFDYGSERGLVFMADAVYREGWDDDAISAIALFLEEGLDPDEAAASLRRELAEATPALSIRSNRGLREEAMAVFDRAFAITGALQMLAISVAFVGVLSVSLSLQLERSRELATLRASGMTLRQLGFLVQIENGLMGLCAALLSWPAGLALALLLIHVINRRSFGWTIQTHLESGPFLAALAIALAAALAAGIYPLLRLRRLEIARLLREE
jgi:putative ABC transport system permease protein